MINWIFAAILMVAYVLETTLMQGLAIFGVVPDLVLVVLIACSINRGKEVALIMGFVVGIAVDLLGGGGFGGDALKYLISACAAGLLGSTFLGKNPVTAVVICAIICASFGVIGSSIRFATGLDREFVSAILKYAVINTVYCSIIEFFVYTLIDGIGVRLYQRRG